MKNKKVMINLGCGYLGHKDWINVDWGILAIINSVPVLKKIIFGLHLAPKSYSKKWPKNLRLVNLRKNFPFNDESVDFVFTAHFIEHLEKYESIWLLSQCYRSLKKGGTIRILVPDLDKAVKHYASNKNALERVDVLNNHFWGVLKKEDSAPSLYVRFLSLFARGHVWLYNFEYMKKILVMSGFSPIRIKQMRFRKGKVPNLDVLDNHPDHSLFVEATK